MMKDFDVAEEARPTLEDMLTMGENENNAYNAFCDYILPAVCGRKSNEAKFNEHYISKVHQRRAKSRNQIVLIPKYLDCNLGIHWLAVGIASNCPVKCQGKIQKAPIPSTTHLARLHYHPGPGPDCCWILAAQTIAYPNWASSLLGLLV
jgi:hypothetical protein